jgi:para-nitrobenzyl esterase
MESGKREDALFNRRNALFAASVVAGAALAPSGAAHAFPSVDGARNGAPGCVTPHSAIVQTRSGKVRGYVSGGVYTFKGVPYGADTGGESRWLPARAPTPWDGERPCLVYGGNSPQNPHNYDAVEHTFLQQWTDGPNTEDMLKLNIWTPTLSGNLPVMVYFHGGGFSFGSAYELSSHDGAQMARNHNVVQVSVNHRLNVLGFLDLAELGGAAYEDSVNVSMTDLVAALSWLRENIARFGGNPDNILIYGQSGGGSKVTTLLGMPRAQGMIHRAIAMAGGGGNAPSAEQSRAFSRRLITELGSPDLAALQRMEWKTLFDTGNRVAQEINGPGGMFGPSPTPRVGWAPTVDGKTITLRSFHDVAPDTSRNVPVIFGCNSEEGMGFSRNPTEEQWRTELTGQFGAEKANALITAMKAAHPEKATRTLSYGVATLRFRNNIQRMVDLKHAQNGAPAYQYLFQWQSPQLDGVCGAWHTAELAFFFDNTRRCEQGTGDTPEARALATKMARAIANFARTGDPSQPGLRWTPSDPERRQTMVFDNRCRMENDPDGAVRRILSS